MKASIKKTKFVIISYQRTGSTYLVSILNQLEGVVCHSELYNRSLDAFKFSIFDSQILPSQNWFDKLLRISPEEKLYKLKNQNPEEFLQRIFNQNSNAIGFKIFPGQDDSIMNLLISDPEIKKILLIRKNLLRCYVSQQIALKTQKWSRHKGEDIVLERIAIDVNSFNAYMNKIKKRMAAIREALISNDQNYLEITFEDITSNFPIKKISQFLELGDVQEVPDVNLERQNPFPLEKIILNYGEVKEMIQAQSLNFF